MVRDISDAAKLAAPVEYGMPFRTILCPVDFSAPSRTALRYAAALADTRSQVIVLYVDDPLLSTAAAVAYGANALNEKTEAELKTFARAALAKTTLPEKAVRFEIVVGKPAAEIVKAAQRLRAEVIVMGTRGATGAARIVLGSTTEAVLRRAQIPVFAVPPAATKLTRARPLAAAR